ncbi:MAG TPA: hypothetical protein VHF58_05910 [Solirubrobacterales bacterium]|nr:hypothetical protein [Solirubrobacterales bacterium]
MRIGKTGPVLLPVAVALFAAPAALAAPPANDNFAAATPINHEVDIRDDQVTDEATMEAGEPTTVNGVSVSHSVWYTWTSPYSGVARMFVGSNGVSPPDPTPIQPMVAVYTGTAVNALNQVAASTGPPASSKAIEFNVTAGTTYHAAVYATNNQSGSMLISYDQDETGVAPPANDNFASAQVITGAPVSATGTSRGATSEANEPNTSPSQATVWYRWTPVGTGPVTIDACGSEINPHLNVYTGTSLGGLTAVAGGASECEAVFDPICGQTYQIRVGAQTQLVFPQRGGIDLDLTQETDGGICPTAGGGGGDGDGGGDNGGGGGVPDRLAPDTEITKQPKKKTTKRRAKFEFASTEAGSNFACKLDGKTFGCTSPLVKKVKPGKHRFEVSAIDPAGNQDVTVDAYRWKVLRAS